MAFQARLLGVALLTALAESLDNSNFDNLTTTAVAGISSAALL